ASEHVEDEPVAHVEARDELLGRRGDELLEGALAPGDEAVLRGLLELELAELLRVVPRLHLHLAVLDDVLGRLADDPAAIVEALPAGAARDLVEVADGDDARLLAVEFAELREEHGADGHVHAHAEGIGAADELEVAALREPLHEEAVLGQEPRVVDADAVEEPALELLAEGRVEAEVADGRLHGLLLLAAEHVGAHEVLRALGRLTLREVDDVDRRAVVLEELADRLVDGRLAIAELEGDGARRARDDGDLHARALLEGGHDGLDVAERGAHQEEARARQLE